MQYLYDTAHLGIWQRTVNLRRRVEHRKRPPCYDSSSAHSAPLLRWLHQHIHQCRPPPRPVRLQYIIAFASTSGTRLSTIGSKFWWSTSLLQEYPKTRKVHILQVVNIYVRTRTPCNRFWTGEETVECLNPREYHQEVLSKLQQER